MKLGTLLYARDRKTWRAWLTKHHASAKEIWLVYPRKRSGKTRIPYSDAVEEALCFGWIDSTTKPIDDTKYAQRFTPRRDTTNWSQHNIERMVRLIQQKKMTPTGLAAYRYHLSLAKATRITIARDILDALKKDPETWKHFRAFPASYRRIRIANIEYYRSHGKESFMKRLNHFLKKTKANKRVGFGHAE